MGVGFPRQRAGGAGRWGDRELRRRFPGLFRGFGEVGSWVGGEGGRRADWARGRGVGRVDGCVEFEPPERVSNGTCNSAGRPGSTPTSGSGGRLPLGALGRSPRGWGGDGGGGRW